MTERIERAVDELDVTIKHIRSAIFGLSSATDTSRAVRNRVLSLLREAATVLGFEPRVFNTVPSTTRCRT